MSFKSFSTTQATPAKDKPVDKPKDAPANEIGRAHVWTPVTDVHRMQSSAWKKKEKKKKNNKNKKKKKKNKLTLSTEMRTDEMRD